NRVAAALRSRLELRLGRSKSQELEAARTQAKGLRDNLRRCVEALASPAGSLGITTQELLWRCHRVRMRTAELPTEIDELSIPDAERLTDIEVGRIVSLAEQLERARQAITESYGSHARHPWNGIGR